MSKKKHIEFPEMLGGKIQLNSNNNLSGIKSRPVSNTSSNLRGSDRTGTKDDGLRTTTTTNINLMKTANGKDGLESQDEGEEEEVSEYETESEQEQAKDSKGSKGGKNLSSGKAGIIWRRFRLKFNKKEARNKLDKIKQGMQKENKI